MKDNNIRDDNKKKNNKRSKKEKIDKKDITDDTKRSFDTKNTVSSQNTKISRQYQKLPPGTTAEERKRIYNERRKEKRKIKELQLLELQKEKIESCENNISHPS